MAKGQTVKVQPNGMYKKVRAVGKPNAPSKMCIRCSEIKPLTEFYTHAEWSTQSYRDAWCKECARNACTSIEGTKEYCHFNNRGWRDDYWEKAGEKASYVLANDAEYINPKTSKRRKAQLRDSCIGRQWLAMMNQKAYYQYVEHVGEDGVYSDGLEKTPADVVQDGDTTERREYSKVWRDYYTPSEIELLEDEYAQLAEDYVLETANMRDYARKVAKASFDADRIASKFRAGQVDLKQYKEAMSLFDELSKSANFAACKRRPGDVKGIGNLGEIIFRVESSGALNGVVLDIPDDNVDKVVHDYTHTLVAVGQQGDFD